MEARPPRPAAKPDFLALHTALRCKRNPLYIKLGIKQPPLDFGRYSRCKQTTASKQAPPPAQNKHGRLRGSAKATPDIKHPAYFAGFSCFAEAA